MNLKVMGCVLIVLALINLYFAVMIKGVSRFLNWFVFALCLAVGICDLFIW